MYTPNAFKKLLPRKDFFVEDTQEQIADIIHGKDPRLLLILGPCSIHSKTAAIEYGKKIKALSCLVEKEALIVMRTYFEKPRTSDGWKGFLNDPNLDESYDLEKGLLEAREILLTLNKMKVPVAMEFVDPNYALYLEDLVSWGCVGARTCSSQPHRHLAARLTCPMGFKNSIHGNLEPAVFSLNAARRPQTFFAPDGDFLPSVIKAPGNPNTHLVLRGSDLKPNCDSRSIHKAMLLLEQEEIKTHILVDCGHGNSQKNPKTQLDVVKNVLKLKRDEGLPICGLMIESHLEEGRQDLSARPIKDTLSITDSCLAFETLKKTILELTHPVNQQSVSQPATCSQPL